MSSFKPKSEQKYRKEKENTIYQNDQIFKFEQIANPIYDSPIPCYKLSVYKLIVYVIVTEINIPDSCYTYAFCKQSVMLTVNF